MFLHRKLAHLSVQSSYENNEEALYTLKFFKIKTKFKNKYSNIALNNKLSMSGFLCTAIFVARAIWLYSLCSPVRLIQPVLTEKNELS